MKRRTAIIVAAMIALGLSVAVGFGLEKEKQSLAANIAAFLAMILLAYPALRINEQGRRIARIVDLEASIQQHESDFAQSNRSPETKVEEEKMLRESRINLATLKKDLSAQKGTWTLRVEICLVGGYLSLSSSALIRLFPGG